MNIDRKYFIIFSALVSSCFLTLLLLFLNGQAGFAARSSRRTEGLIYTKPQIYIAGPSTTVTVSGTITHGGVPLTGIDVYVVWNSGSADIVTGPDGIYSASGIPSGENVFVSVLPNVGMGLEYRYWYTTVNSDTVKDFELRSGYLLTGRFVEPDGAPYDGPAPHLDALGSTLPTSEMYVFELDSGGYFTSVLAADFYTLYFYREPVPEYYLPPTVIDLRYGDHTGHLINLLRRPVPLPDEPPNTSLIEVSAPDAEGYATIHGSPGSVQPLSAVMVDNLNSSSLAVTASDAKGAFTTTLFAPPGSWLMIKNDPSGERISVAWAWSKEDDKETAVDLQSLPGTTLYVGDHPSGGEGWQEFDAVGRFGFWAGWWLSGTIQTENKAPSPGIGLPVQAGETFTVSAHLLITSPALDCNGVPTYTIVGNGALYYLFDDQGRALQNGRWFNSFLFTPTGLPIEHESDTEIENLETHQFTNLACVTNHTIEADLEQTYTIPVSLPDGIYQPGLLILPDIPQQSGLPTLVTWSYDPETATLPPIRVGEPITPHIPWTLLSNYAVNGLRGLQALQDKGRYALPDRVRMSPDLVVMPRLDERSGEPLVYRLEPGSMWLSGSDRRPPPPPYLALDLQSGNLTITVAKPGGGVDVLGPAQTTQSWVYTPGLLDNNELHKGTGNITDMFHLYRNDGTFAYSFQEYGFHTISLFGSIEDIFGNSYPVESTYELLVARVLDLDSAQLPTTPYEVGDFFAPGLHVYPPLPAHVDINLVHLPESDIAQSEHYTASGQANLYGYFQPGGQKYEFLSPGEFRVDLTAQYMAEDGTLWAGTTTWGNAVASPAARFEVHGRRGMNYPRDEIDPKMPAWFTNEGLDDYWRGTENFYPYFNGDILWGSELEEKGDSLHTDLTIKDLTPGEEIYNLMRNFFLRATNSYFPPPIVVNFDGFEQRISIGEAPLFISTKTGKDPTVDREEIDFFSYWYGSSERPDVHVREIISVDGISTAYWRYNDNYGKQIAEPADGDQPGDLKWNFGGVVFRVISQTNPINEYNIYGSFWVLLPHDDPVGARVTPPFQEAAGGLNGGPIMELLGEEIDMLFLPKGVRPGDILQLGDIVSFPGHVGPTLDSRVAVTITSPNDVHYTADWHANKIGWLYDPDFDFVADEVGRWTVEVFIEHDRPYLPTGITPASHNTGTVLGTQGQYEFYVVDSSSPGLHISSPDPGFITWPDSQIEPITIRGQAPLGTTEVHYTIHDKGIVMGQGMLTLSPGGDFTLVYDAEALHQDFPMLSLTAREGVWEGLADEVAINFLAVGSTDGPVAAAVTLIGEEVFVQGGLEPVYNLNYMPLVVR